ncbi:taste receptor type 2 member 14-like [Ochotona curzoniae]|uniref:taste receptor type 2 member 14-like n=1 Tax=Ochotona curzoniae TaxID=130825 RepID=UPI001B34F256|nr:taste receptor type 2 member 14-like [Ochotona curzoniae]
MAGVILTIFAVISYIEFIIGNIGNGFIVLVNCNDWFKRRKISSVDKITIALAVSRIGLMWCRFLPQWVSVVPPLSQGTVVMFRTIHIVWTVTNHWNFWLATGLSIFYFLKIAIFSNSTFLYLKWRVEKVVSVTLLLSMFILIFNITRENIHFAAQYKGYKENLTLIAWFEESSHLFKVFLVIDTIFMIIPVTLSLISFLLLIFSLWRHLRQMQLDVMGSRDASTKAHLRGLQTVVAFLVLATIFFTSAFLRKWNRETLEEGLLLRICRSFIMAYPSIHSCVLILVNKKLRKAFLLVLWWLSCKFKDAER